MSLRTAKFRRSSPPAEEEEEQEQALVQAEPPPPSSSQQAISQALASTAHLANLLPTGTLLAFQLLIPVFTNNGACDDVTRLMTLALLLLLAASCFLASFTDSFRSSGDGRVYYGIATRSGMWLFDHNAASAAALPDTSKYRLQPIDFVHAVLSVLVFASVALRDRNAVSCFYPRPSHEAQEVFDILPLGVGVLCSLLFVAFPTRRHGIGYPVTDGS
ncbi:hypothetical protein Cni_G05112 [Canna indica]|uniref:Uncharacterized protein n=1 Tax=Canna indica TaxID=4628 RepID=A0AAQ3Q2X3_9LILI|nr:hypothetical protein Cni_G05112 [Canna indica]